MALFDSAPSDSPEAGGSDAGSPSGTSLSDRARSQLERVNESLEAVGMSPHGTSTLLVWWRRIGLARLASLAFLFGLPAGGYSTLLYTASRSIPDWVGDFGVQFEARDTDISLFSLQVTARDVRVRADARSEPVFTASEVVFDGSLATLFSGLFGPGAFYNEITIRQGELHLERSLAGAWNVEEFIARVPAARREAALAGLYRINGLYLENLKIVYTEHVPGGSGGGVIQTSQATVYVDDVNGWVTDLMPPEQPGAQPTRYELKGRSADGIVEVKGTAAFFDQAGAPGSAGLRAVSSGGESPIAAGLAGASFQMNLYLENIGLAAYAQMVPTTRLLPTRGSLRGTLEVQRSNAGFICRSNLGAQDLEFAPNPRLVVVKAQFDRLQQDLEGFRTSGPFDPCGNDMPAPDRPPESAGTMTGVLASFNEQTTQSAPPSVRAFAAVDAQHLQGAAAEVAIASVMNSLTGRMGSAVGGMAGQQVRSLAASGGQQDGAGGNAVSRGVRSIGGGFRRLFGGGDRDRQAAPPAKPSGSR